MSRPPLPAERDRLQLRDLVEQLGALRADGPPIFESWLPQLRELLGSDVGLLYELRQESAGFGLDRLAESRSPVPRKNLLAALGELVFSSPERWGLFNPTRPEPEQRNRSLVHPPLGHSIRHPAPGVLDRYGLSAREKEQYAAEVLARLSETYTRMGIRDLWQLRVLVCEGDSLLAWVGGFSPEPPDARVQGLLEQAVPAIRRRLLLERTLARGPLIEGALAATMEAIPRPAFLASERGAVLQANAAGRALLERAPCDTRRAIAEALRPREGAGPFQVTPVTAAGRRPIYLLIGGAPPGLQARVAGLAQRWELTPRQGEVLRMVVQGDANRTIAARLGCAERTIEQHLTALLAKSCAESRSMLIARFFLGG